MRSLGLRTVLPLFIALAFTGCLRFTPSRSDLYSAKTPSGKASAGLSGTSFREYEQKQQQRLTNLVEERSANISGVDDLYRIGPGDLIKLFVFDVQDLNISARVKQSGVLTLPLMGDLPVAGLTESELQDTITNRLRHYVKNPSVNVAIVDYRAYRVSVNGEVARPGTYALKRGDFSLIDVLSEAGGRTERAGATVILIPASEAKVANLTGQKGRAVLSPNARGTMNAQGVEIPYEDLVGSAERVPLNLAVLPGDTIIIPAAGKLQVDGEVKSPGSFELTSKTTLLGAIATTGGLTYSADVNRVEVLREVEPGKKALLTVDLEKVIAGSEQDVRLRDGDLVRVPSATGRFMTRQVIEGINSLVNFGVGGSVNLAR